MISTVCGDEVAASCELVVLDEGIVVVTSGGLIVSVAGTVIVISKGLVASMVDEEVNQEV